MATEFMATAQEEIPYIVFELNQCKYAVSSRQVMSIQTYSTCTPMVETPEHIMGIVIFQGESVPILNLRALFGLGSYEDELAEFMHARIKNHEDWMAALEESVKTNTEFKLTTDPHACAFGKWYDTFESDNNSLRLHLQRVDAPHRAIHHSGEKVKALMDQGRQEEAMALVEDVKHTHFKETTQLLAEAATAFIEGARRVNIILEINGCALGILVDKIESVEYLENVQKLPDTLTDCAYVSMIAQTTRSEMVYLLETAALI